MPAAGDFNGDGKLDLALPGMQATVMLGNGDGTFQPAREFPAGNQPISIASGDFNGDGRLDLAVSNAASSDVSILLGNGDGTFQPAKNFAATPGAVPVSIVVADFDRNGKLDVAVADQAGCGSAPCSTVTVLLGNGDGTLLRPARHFTVGPAPNGLAVGDFNRDANPDLAVTDSRGHVSILSGNGDGTFRPAVSITLPQAGGSAAFGVAAGDFNADGNQDLAVAAPFAGFIFALLGNGNGTFQPAVGFPDALAQVPSWVAAGDFNGDGKQDLAVALSWCCNASGDGALGVMSGNGDGTFQALVRYLVPGYVIPDAATFVGVADVNNDGKPDVLLPQTGVIGGTTVLMNTTGLAGPVK